MKYGVVFPQLEIGNDPSVIKDYAQTAEDLGYDYLLAFDHVLGANADRPGWDGLHDHRAAFHEPLVLYGYLAGLTHTIELVTGILILPQRQTALVAKQAAQVDLLSGGRLRLGVGVGWNSVEYEALGTNFHNRGKRIEEQVALLRKLWTAPLITFRGDYHTVSDAGLNPLPVQQPIPIWFGGWADATLRRMARLGDGWIIVGREPNDKMKAELEKLRGYVEAAGRDPRAFGVDSWINTANNTPDEWAKQVAGWKALGATHVALNTMWKGLKSPQEHLHAIRQFRSVVE